MPVLALETFLHPDNLLASNMPQSESDRWWVLHTKPRAEKQVARRLLDRQQAFFLPLQHKRRWMNQSRKFESHLPMFPSYVFLHGSHDARLLALSTNLIVHVLPVADQTQLHDDLLGIHRVMMSGIQVTPETVLLPGTPVEIVDGPFIGMRGKFLARAGSYRLFVEVRFLRCGVSVEVEPHMVKAIEAGDPVPC